jgi:tRNA(His) guanylyltransferase
LYNTTFWALVLKGGLKEREAEEALQGTTAADKNEILFSRFGINYNQEDEMFKKGTMIYRNFVEDKKNKVGIVIENVDIIKDAFWNERPWILSGRPANSKKGQC